MKINSPVKILLVDDLPENLFALEVILSNENYLCVKANSGNEALKILLHQQDFAIILIDVQMPMMDGFETVELIQQIDKLKHVPIIFLTASMDNSLQIFKGYQAGAVDYMIKPISPEILKAKVAVFVDLHTKNQELLLQAQQLKKLNTDLKAQKSRSEYSLSLIEASHDPLFAINPEGKITDMNNASLKETGISRQELIGTDFFNYFTEPLKAREVYQNVFEKGFIANCPLVLCHKNGSLIDVLFNGAVYKDDKGNVLGAAIVARDVTNQKRSEKELIEAKIKAEKAAITAESAVKAKQQFLSNMSHEIRTPMNAIIGFTKVILRTELTDKQKEYLSAIKVSGDALIFLINDILDLAKVDAGRMTFEKTPFKMKSSIKSMLHLFENKIHEKNLKLITEYDNKIPHVLVGDPIRLHQIILNLVSNAVKFTFKGKITVSVDLLHEDDGKVILKFAITDTGIGISEEKIGTIFENFQQATTGTSRLYGGTGLGLAIVQQLVEPQGGSIRVNSIIHEGSTFSFTLPFQKTDAGAELENEVELLDPKVNNVKVLVVEDIPLNQLLMKTLLDDFGFERDIAENGQIAIEKIKKNNYEIILMDLQMPVMNGFEATEYIRKKLNLSIPIIAITADVTTVDLAKCKAVGMNDYIPKPVDERLLYNKIINILKKPNQTKIGTISAETNSTIDHKEVGNKTTKYVNLEYLYQRTKSNPILIKEMISLYLAQTPPIVITMKQSLANENWSLLGASAHKLIPSFSIMGISSNYADMAKKIQELASTPEKFQEIRELVLQLEKVCLRACTELQDELNTI